MVEVTYPVVYCVKVVIWLVVAGETGVVTEYETGAEVV